MLVSELEKNPERMMSAARIEKSKPSGASFNAGVGLVISRGSHLEEKASWGQAFRCRLAALQYQFENQLGAKVSQH